MRPGTLAGQRTQLSTILRRRSQKLTNFRFEQEPNDFARRSGPRAPLRRRRPASTLVEVSALAHPDALLEVEAVVYAP
jgi:hypothetical protein